MGAEQIETHGYTYREIAQEIQVMGVTRKYSPAYIGRIVTEYDSSAELSTLIPIAIDRLCAKARLTLAAN